jgi:hypothetical protein
VSWIAASRRGRRHTHHGAGQLVVDPADDAHIVARTTYGVIVSRDRGATWRWVCESAVGYTGSFDPAIASPPGAVLAGVPSHDDRSGGAPYRSEQRLRRRAEARLPGRRERRVRDGHRVPGGLHLPDDDRASA